MSEKFTPEDLEVAAVAYESNGDYLAADLARKRAQYLRKHPGFRHYMKLTFRAFLAFVLVLVVLILLVAAKIFLEDWFKGNRQQNSKIVDHSNEIAGTLAVTSTNLTGTIKIYSIPEIRGSIALPVTWHQVAANQVEKNTADMLRLRPQTNLKYIAGFSRSESNAGQADAYIWIQANRIRLPDSTPEQVAAAMSKIPVTGKAAVEQYYPDVLGFDRPHYDATLGAIGYSVAETAEGGGTNVYHAYLFVIKNGVISINVYPSHENAAAVFGEAEHIVSTLTIPDEDHMPISWSNQLGRLLNKPQ